MHSFGWALIGLFIFHAVSLLFMLLLVFQFFRIKGQRTGFLRSIDEKRHAAVHESSILLWLYVLMIIIVTALLTLYFVALTAVVTAPTPTTL